jgi:phosphinothricin acetyltransferase
VAGFARVTRASDRDAYSGVGEYTIYVARWARGRRVGAALLRELVLTAERLGYWKLMGRLLLTNEGSAALARRCGFERVGVHRRHARLDGRWRDVLLVERLIGEAARD